MNAVSVGVTDSAASVASVWVGVTDSAASVSVGVTDSLADFVARAVSVAVGLFLGVAVGGRWRLSRRIFVLIVLHLEELPVLRTRHDFIVGLHRNNVIR